MASRNLTTSPRRVELKIDADAANLAVVRKAVEGLARESAFPADAVDQIGLCVNEAMANIIRHAYHGVIGRPIHVVADADDQAMMITLRDWGNGIDPSRLPKRPYDPLKPGGVGMICLRRWMDEVLYLPQPDGMLTTLKKRKIRPGT